MPVCELLGGRIKQTTPIISSVHVEAPNRMRRHVAELRAQGYIGHSIKVGDDPNTNAKNIVESMADRQPGEFYLVDANGGLTVESALRMLRLLPQGLDFVPEAPCATWRECISLRRRTDLPIIFDELSTNDASLMQMIADDAADSIGLKISKSGGLTKARRQRDMCIAAGLTVSVQETAGSDIAFAAIVHLAQTVPQRLLRCCLESRDLVTQKTADGLYNGAFEVVGGRVEAPHSPGLGIKPRMDVIGRPVATYN